MIPLKMKETLMSQSLLPDWAKLSMMAASTAHNGTIGRVQEE